MSLEDNSRTRLKSTIYYTLLFKKLLRGLKISLKISFIFLKCKYMKEICYNYSTQMPLFIIKKSQFESLQILKSFMKNIEILKPMTNSDNLI